MFSKIFFSQGFNYYWVGSSFTWCANGFIIFLMCQLSLDYVGIKVGNYGLILATTIILMLGSAIDIFERGSELDERVAIVFSF